MLGSRARPGRGCPSGGAPGAPVLGCVCPFRAPAQLGPWWVVGSVGAFPGGPAGRGRWLAYPAVVRAGVWPLPLSGVLGGVAGVCAAFGASPSPLFEYFLRRGFLRRGFALLWPVAWAGLCPVASSWVSVRPSLGAACACVGGAVRVGGWACARWWGAGGFGVAPPPVPLVPRVGMPPRQVWRVVSRMRRPARPRGRGRPDRCGSWRACGRAPPRRAAIGIQKVLVVGARSDLARFAQGAFHPALRAGSVRLQLRLRKGNALPQIGQYRQYSLTGYPQNGHRGPSG